MNERKKGIPLVLVIIVVLLIIGTGGYFISKAIVGDKKEVSNKEIEEVNEDKKNVITESEAYVIVEKLYSKLMEISYKYPAKDFLLTEVNYEGGIKEVTNYMDIVGKVFTPDGIKAYEKNAENIIYHIDGKIYMVISEKILGLDYIGKVFNKFEIQEDTIKLVVDSQYQGDKENTKIRHEENEMTLKLVDGTWLIEEYVLPE